MADEIDETDRAAWRSRVSEELLEESGYYFHDRVPGFEDAAIVDFLDFIQEVYEGDAREDGYIGCLADALLAWIVGGNATKKCTSFEHYLRVVLCIIAGWNDEGGRHWAGHRYEFPMRSAEFAWSRRHYPRIVIPTLVRKGSDVQMRNHPAFQPDTFECARLARSESTTTE